MLLIQVQNPLGCPKASVSAFQHTGGKGSLFFFLLFFSDLTFSENNPYVRVMDLRVTNSVSLCT